MKIHQNPQRNLQQISPEESSQTSIATLVDTLYDSLFGFPAGAILGDSSGQSPSHMLHVWNIYCTNICPKNHPVL